jgi:hypothetical protein
MTLIYAKARRKETAKAEDRIRILARLVARHGGRAPAHEARRAASMITSLPCQPPASIDSKLSLGR